MENDQNGLRGRTTAILTLLLLMVRTGWTQHKATTITTNVIRMLSIFSYLSATILTKPNQWVFPLWISCQCPYGKVTKRNDFQYPQLDYLPLISVECHKGSFMYRNSTNASKASKVFVIW